MIVYVIICYKDNMLYDNFFEELVNFVKNRVVMVVSFINVLV